MINTANAQVNVQVNIGNQPEWGPTGYDYAQYYYFPDYDFYYDIDRAEYIIFKNKIWSYVKLLTSSYRFDPYNAYKVVVNQNNPYMHNKSHRTKYKNFKGQGPKQPMIKDNGHPNAPNTSNTPNNGHPNNTNNGPRTKKNDKKSVQQNPKNGGDRKTPKNGGR